MKKHLYEAAFTPYDNGKYEVEFPELDLFTQGNSLSDAVYMAQNLLSMEIAARLERGENVPEIGHFGTTCPEGSTLIGVMTFAEAGKTDIETMTAEEAADVLNVSRARIYAMVRSGILKSRKAGSAVLVSADSVMERFNSPRKAGRPRKKLARA